MEESPKVVAEVVVKVDMVEEVDKAEPKVLQALLLLPENGPSRLLHCSIMQPQHS